MDGVELFQTWRKNILTKSKVLLWFIFYYTKFLDCFYAHEKRVYPIFVYLSKIILPKTDKNYSAAIITYFRKNWDCLRVKIIKI